MSMVGIELVAPACLVVFMGVSFGILYVMEWARQKWKIRRR